MLVDLVQVTTRDGVRLHGALELPEETSDSASGESSQNPRLRFGLVIEQPSLARRVSGANTDDSPVDAWLCIHGTGSNFYAASTLAGLAPKLQAGGAAVLRVNTRGHDMVATGPSAGNRSLQGAAFERVDESPLDLAAWVDLLHERGFRRVGILGHSLGAVKASYTLAQADRPSIASLVAVSPPRLSYSHFLATPRAEEFRRTFVAAEELVASGRGDELMQIDFPLRYYVTAAGFVDRYGPEERYNVLKLLDRVAVPTLVTYGSSELQGDFAFRGMAEAVEKLATPANRLEVAVIAGADHIYTGCHDALARRIARWLAKPARWAAAGQ